MRAQQIIYTWDYHHGQATRVVMGGLPPLRGKSMPEKQDDFIRQYDSVRTSLMQEPRGHKNMLGAVITGPATSDGTAGILFLSPQGYFEMCGDSTFSAVAALVDSGMVTSKYPDGELTVKLDTVAGRVDVHVIIKDNEPVEITFANVPSYALGNCSISVPDIGEVNVELGYGGLTYAFVEAKTLGIQSLKTIDRDDLIELGTRVWRSAREQIKLPGYVGPDELGESRPVDLITIRESLIDARGSRVANFYAPHTCGRTPSGTGLSARTAIEVAAGRLKQGETYIHESLLGLQFIARPIKVDIARIGNGHSGCIPAVTARSFLMGICQWVLHPEDPFRHGFVF